MKNPFVEKVFSTGNMSEINLVYCGKREKSYMHSYDNSNRNLYLLIFVHEGTADFNINSNKIQLHKNDFYVMFPFSKMSYVTNAEEPWTISWVGATGKNLEKIFNNIGITRVNPCVSLQHPTRIKNIYENLYEKTNRTDVTSEMACFSLFYKLLSAVAEENSSIYQTSYIQEALDYMHTHYTDNQCKDSLCEMFFLNKNYFSRIFKKETGLTPTQYICELRLKKAIQLLNFTNMTISEIAGYVGYQDALYFSRIFKNKMNMSPKEYRKKFTEKTTTEC